MELTEEQKLVTGIADYFNIEVPDIISEYVTDGTPGELLQEKDKITL